jgi:hypothetical protein
VCGSFWMNAYLNNNYKCEAEFKHLLEILNELGCLLRDIDEGVKSNPINIVD